jgi:hypothetical protein
MAPRTSLGVNPTIVPAGTATYAVSLNDNGRTFITSGDDKNSVVDFTIPSPSFEGFRLRIGVGRKGRPARINARSTIAFPRRSSLTTLDDSDVSHEGELVILSRDPGAFIDLVWGPLEDNYWHVAGGAGLWVHEEDDLSEFHLMDLPSPGKMDFGKPAGTTSTWVSVPLFTPYEVPA